MRVRSWQHFYLIDDSIVMIYTGGKGLFYTRSRDGISFGDFVKVGARAAQPKLSYFENGTMVYSFQRGNWRKGYMSSMFSVSKDAGNSWSEAIKISDSHINVHDAFLFKREDGGLDSYFVYPIGDWRGFSLFRRCIKEDLSLGKEEQIIEKQMGNVIAPALTRLPDGQILLTFNEQLSGYTPYATIINGDADCD